MPSTDRDKVMSTMRISESTRTRMVISRSSLSDRLFFSASIAVGIAVLFLADDLDVPTWARVCFCALFVSGGIIFWILSARVTVTLDGRAGDARVHWARVLGDRTVSARLDDVVELRVQRGEDAGRLRFHLKDGSTIPLTPYSFTGGDNPDVMERVNSWLASWKRTNT